MKFAQEAQISVKNGEGENQQTAQIQLRFSETIQLWSPGFGVLACLPRLVCPGL